MLITQWFGTHHWRCVFSLNLLTRGKTGHFWEVQTNKYSAIPRKLTTVLHCHIQERQKGKVVGETQINYWFPQKEKLLDASNLLSTYLVNPGKYLTSTPNLSAARYAFSCSFAFIDNILIALQIVISSTPSSRSCDKDRGYRVVQNEDKISCRLTKASQGFICVDKSDETRRRIKRSWSRQMCSLGRITDPAFEPLEQIKKYPKRQGLGTSSLPRFTL